MLDFQDAARSVPPEGTQLPASVVIVARKDVWGEQYVAVVHVEVTVCVEHEGAPQSGPPKDRTDAVVQLPVGGAQAHGSQPGLGGSGSFPPVVVATNPVGQARPAPRLSSKATGPVHPAGGAVAHAQLGGGTGVVSAASPGAPLSVWGVPVSASGVAGSSPTKSSPAPVSALHASIAIDARPNQPTPRSARIPVGSNLAGRGRARARTHAMGAREHQAALAGGEQRHRRARAAARALPPAFHGPKRWG